MESSLFNRLDNLIELVRKRLALLDEEYSIIHELLTNIERFPGMNTHVDEIYRQYIDELEHIRRLKEENHRFLELLHKIKETYECASAGINSTFSYGTSKDWGSSESEHRYQNNGITYSIGEECQEDTIFSTKDAEKETESIAASKPESSINTPMSEQERSALRRKLLAEALRRGEPVTISSTGEISGFSTTEIAENKDAGPGTIEPENCSITVPDGKLAGGHGMCRICGTIFYQETNYCPKCGTKAEIEKPTVELDKVQFSAVAPQTLVKGDYSIIEIIMYEEAFRYVVDEAIANAEEPAKETKSGRLIVEKNAKVSIHLSSPDIEIVDNNEVQTWQGDYLSFGFAVEIPEQYKKNQILFVASVYFDGIIATRLKFVAKCKSQMGQKIEVLRDDVLSAFVSYASQDRQRVAMIIQGMKKARPDMDVFFDVDSLRSGDDWEKALWREIDRRDILFLCWSRYARASKWVDAEWRYALKQKGVDYIEPIPIDPPGSCPPPDELSRKHFNDKLLYIINASEDSSPKSEL